jgi:hypothetical protein
MRFKPKHTCDKPSVDQVIEAALHDLDPERYPQDRAIAERWAHEANLPALSDANGAEILEHPEEEYDSDTRARFRRWLLGQPNGRVLYSDWIKARMCLREEGKLAPDSATSQDGRRKWAQRVEAT